MQYLHSSEKVKSGVANVAAENSIKMQLQADCAGCPAFGATNAAEEIECKNEN